MSLSKLLPMVGFLASTVNAVAIAQAPTNGGPGLQPCPFNETLGPNLLVAVVKVPDGRKEIGAWIYGSGWCSNYNTISGGKDICGKEPVEYMHIPLSDKFGDFTNNNCYNNVEVSFEDCHGCDGGQSCESSHERRDEPTGYPTNTTTEVDYKEVKARFKSTLDGTEVTYPCRSTKELRACVYAPGVQDSLVSYTAFLDCGVTAMP